MKNLLSQIFYDKLELPIEGIANVPTVQITGDNVVNIEGCIGIKKYELNEIVLRCKAHLLSVYGGDLTMLTFSQGRICIRGVLRKFEIERVK